MVARRALFRYFCAAMGAIALPIPSRSNPSTKVICHPLKSSETAIDFDLDQDLHRNSRIVVIGVGGGGITAVQYMIDLNLSGVDFVCVDTDLQHLGSNSSDQSRSRFRQFIHLGSAEFGLGLSTVENQNLARQAALQSESALRSALSGAGLVFITASMGDSTGTGAAPVIARIAKQLGILTFGLVTMPLELELEGQHRIDIALLELQANVDALIEVPTEKLLSVGGQHQYVGYAKSNDLMKTVINGFCCMINTPSPSNIDLDDVRTIVREPGRTVLSQAVARGVDRAVIATEQALNSPLMAGFDLSNAKGLLVQISAAKGSLKLSESRQVMKTIRDHTDPSAYFIYGTSYENNLNDELRVTILAKV